MLLHISLARVRAIVATPAWSTNCALLCVYFCALLCVFLPILYLAWGLSPLHVIHAICLLHVCTRLFVVFSPSRRLLGKPSHDSLWVLVVDASRAAWRQCYVSVFLYNVWGRGPVTHLVHTQQKDTTFVCMTRAHNVRPGCIVAVLVCSTACTP